MHHTTVISYNNMFDSKLTVSIVGNRFIFTESIYRCEFWPFQLFYFLNVDVYCGDKKMQKEA